MPYRLPEKTIELALRHLCRYGDTDIFPHLPELAFFADQEPGVATELSSVDLDSYSPGGAIEALAPKSRYGFRIAHQLSPLDNVFMLGCAIELGAAIEALRPTRSGRSRIASSPMIKAESSTKSTVSKIGCSPRRDISRRTEQSRQSSQPTSPTFMRGSISIVSTICSTR